MENTNNNKTLQRKKKKSLLSAHPPQKSALRYTNIGSDYIDISFGYCCALKSPEKEIGKRGSS